MRANPEVDGEARSALARDVVSPSTTGSEEREGTNLVRITTTDYTTSSRESRGEITRERRGNLIRLEPSRLRVRR